MNPSSYTYNISESAAVGTEIATVEARDADSGINSQIRYSIANGNELDIVNINSDSGKITLTRALGMSDTITFCKRSLFCSNLTYLILLRSTGKCLEMLCVKV